MIVPRRLRAEWRQEWEAELRYREMLLAEWDKLDWRNKIDLLRRSLGAFWDALLLQPQRLEDEMFQDLRYGVRMLIKKPGFTVSPSSRWRSASAQTPQFSASSMRCCCAPCLIQKPMNWRCSISRARGEEDWD